MQPYTFVKKFFFKNYHDGYCRIEDRDWPLIGMQIFDVSLYKAGQFSQVQLLMGKRTAKGEVNFYIWDPERAEAFYEKLLSCALKSRYLGSDIGGIIIQKEKEKTSIDI